jgi:hypothetical protein
LEYFDMFVRRLNTSLAYKLDQVDPQLDATRDEGEKRLVPLRAVLRCAANKLGRPELVDANSDDSLGAILSFKKSAEHGRAALESIMSGSSACKARLCLLCSNSKLLTVFELDELDESDRVKCVPILQSDTAALPLDGESDSGSRVLVTLPKEACAGNREAKLDVSRLDKTSIGITSVSSMGIRKYLKAEDLPEMLLNRLFDSGNDIAMPGSTGAPRRKNELPDYLKVALTSFLEHRMRLQVMCTASMPDPVTRPVALERAYMRSYDSEKRKWLCIAAQLHPTSSSCICGSHGMKFDWKGNVEVRLETCGRVLEDFNGCMRCPCHERAIGDDGNARFSIDGICTEDTQITVTCSHRNGKACKRGICMDSMKLTDADRLELSNILVNMAEFESRTFDWFKNGWSTDRDQVARFTDLLGEKFRKNMADVERMQLAEQDPEVHDPREMLRRDMVAVDLMRKGGVFRHTVKRGERRGAPYLQRAKRTDDTPPLKPHETALAETHIHLFRKSF